MSLLGPTSGSDESLVLLLLLLLSAHPLLLVHLLVLHQLELLMVNYLLLLEEAVVFLLVQHQVLVLLILFRRPLSFRQPCYALAPIELFLPFFLCVLLCILLCEGVFHELHRQVVDLLQLINDNLTVLQIVIVLWHFLLSVGVVGQLGCVFVAHVGAADLVHREVGLAVVFKGGISLLPTSIPLLRHLLRTLLPRRLPLRETHCRRLNVAK